MDEGVGVPVGLLLECCCCCWNDEKFPRDAKLSRAVPRLRLSTLSPPPPVRSGLTTNRQKQNGRMKKNMIYIWLSWLLQPASSGSVSRTDP